MKRYPTIEPNKSFIVFVLVLLFGGYARAQDLSNLQFGKLAASDFNLSVYHFDSTAAAVVIADIGESHYENIDLKGSRRVFTRYRRIKILRKEGFSAATITIPFYSTDANGQRVYNLKASTYNLEKGQVMETKLDEKSVYQENLTQYIYQNKFAMPDVREGSIIEFSFSIESGIMNSLQAWDFQGRYPCSWSDYTAIIPDMFKYLTLVQGTLPFTINTTKGEKVYNTNAVAHHWAMKNVPAMVEENYTTTINNYISKIEFRLTAIDWPSRRARAEQTVLPRWKEIAENLMNSDNFGKAITKNNGWLTDVMKPILGNAAGQLEKAVRIYDFVRDSFKCEQHTGMTLKSSMKTIYENRSGDEAEINMLLAAMLIHAGIQSDPIILSTRNHGFVDEAYPILENYNYLICDAIIDSATYYLDASQQFLTFNLLPAYCFNGQARVINQDNPRMVYFDANALLEKKQTSVFITNDDKNAGDVGGNIQMRLGYYSSLQLRERIAKRRPSDSIKEMQARYGDRMKIENAGVDSLTLKQYPVNVHYDFLLKGYLKNDILYFNPVMEGALTENPLKSQNRQYPVEMPYASDEIYTLDMEIPPGLPWMKCRNQPKSC